MKILRTPEERFAHLPDFPFASHYADLGGIRMHYLDEGKNEQEVVLMLHGEPSWCFLYRKMIPILVSSGFRVVAPDLIGFGKSDKPVDPDAHTYQAHVDWMVAFVQQLNLQQITLVAQDWGGLIGLRVAAEHASRFKRIVAANTFLPTGDQQPPEAFFQWREFSQKTRVFDVGKVVQLGCVSELPAEVVAAYDAPFPEESYKVAARRFPMLVPVSPDDPAAAANRRAWQVLRNWQKPFITIFSDSDPITRGAETYLQKFIPGAKGQDHAILRNAGHFLQEDQGEVFAQKVAAFMQST